MKGSLEMGQLFAVLQYMKGGQGAAQFVHAGGIQFTFDLFDPMGAARHSFVRLLARRASNLLFPGSCPPFSPIVVPLLGTPEMAGVR